MSMRFAAAVLGVLLVAACAAEDPEAKATACGVNEQPQGGVEQAYLGLSQAAAERMADEADLVLRTLGEDGRCTARDSDRRTDRINVYVEDGEVTAARIF
jgi:hypothetical protein